MNITFDAAKVRRFENRLKLSIRGKIVGLCLQDMDSMVRKTLAIEREMENARGIRDESVGGKRKKDQPSSSLGKRQGTSIPRAPQVQGQPEPMTCFYCHKPGHEAGLPMEAWISRFWADAVPVISGTNAYTFYSSTPQYESEQPVSVTE